MPDNDTPPHPGETSTGLSPNAAAAIACFFPLIGGLIMLVLEAKNRFVRFYALQSIFFAVAWVVAYVAIKVSIRLFQLLPVVGGPMAQLLEIGWMVLGLAFFILWVIQLIKAISGVEWEIPYLGPFARKQMRQP